MKIGNRELSRVLSAPFQDRNRVAARNLLTVYRKPADAFARYFLGRGIYPADIGVNTPTGPIALTCASHDDMLTINEIFCRLDYAATADDRVIVDFGSNIGISAAFFLTRSPQAFCYLYEPLQFNIARLRRNLRPFDGRYALHEVAVGLGDGEVEFGWEESGRYGGVGLKTGNYVSVKCVDSNSVLEAVIARHGAIDILKIDIETLERQVTERIPVALARKIGKVYVEFPFQRNPLEATHDWRQYGGVAQFTNRNGSGRPSGQRHEAQGG